MRLVWINAILNTTCKIDARSGLESLVTISAMLNLRPSGGGVRYHPVAFFFCV